MDELARQIGKEFGESDGVLVIDPSAHEKKGHESVGVDRQWSGRLAKITNCQVGIYLGYVSRKGQALVDQRLFLSKNWVGDMERRRKCGVPDEVVPQTRHEMALEMIGKRGGHLPHGWVTADDEIGHPSRFRRNLSDMGERYLMAVPSNVTIRDLEGRSPKGPGRRGQKKVRPFEQMRAWLKHRPAREWKRITVRKAEKGPIVVECMKRRVRAKNERRTPGPEELMFITRQLVGETVKYDFYLSNAKPDTPLAELARVANAEHRIEECFQRAKTETGMSDYEVRTWKGWHHHHALVFMAIWFLTLAAHRGKKGDARDDGASGEGLDRRTVA
jgi:SRSO17 transposase